MSAQPKHLYTEAEYLLMERDSDIKHEFYDGEIFAMAGSSQNHDDIAVNTIASLHSQLLRRPCRVNSSDMRVRVSPIGYYTYPDIKVVCGEPQFTADNPPSLLNPTLIIEVLSPSTEVYDRNDKFRQYEMIESLQEYVLIAQTIPRIERYLRQPDDEWLYKSVVGLEASLDLASIQCTLALADVYSRIDFAE